MMKTPPEVLTQEEVEGVHLQEKPAHFKRTGPGRYDFATVLPGAPKPAGLKAMLMRHFSGLRTAVFFQANMEPIVCCILIFKPECWWSLGIYQAWVKRKSVVLLREQMPPGGKLAGVWW